MMNYWIIAGAVLLLGSAAQVVAQTTSEHDTHPVRTAASANATDTVAAEVRKVDKSAGKITLTHEPIPNLEMPKMTMVFRIKDPAMLDHVRSGDNVRFAAERIDGMLTVVRLDLPN